MQLVNIDDKVSCTIADVDDSGDTLQCLNALPAPETFDNGEDYEVVGDGTNDSSSGSVRATAPAAPAPAASTVPSTPRAPASSIRSRCPSTSTSSRG